MIKEIYCIYDNKTEMYNQPLFEDNLETITEILKGVAQSFEDDGINPAEYDLFQVGRFNTENGKIEPFETPKHIYNITKIAQGRNDGE